MSNICSIILTFIVINSTLVLNRCSNKGCYMKMRSIKINLKSFKRTMSYILFLLVMISLVCFLIPSAKVGGENSTNYISYCIQQGDTLWSIAQSITKGNKDVRETLYKIRKLNGLEDSCAIKTGETILLPSD